MTRSIISRSSIYSAAISTALILSPLAAQAYVGPGAGLTAIGTMVALLAALVLAVIGFVWYPVKRLMAKRKMASISSSEPARPREDGGR